MITKAIFAGFGGQGILKMGHLIANAAMKEDKFLTFMPSYGAEVRGGTAHCTVSVGDEEIASPIASSPDYIVIMNAPSLGRFQNILRKDGGCFLNTSIVQDKAIRKDIKMYGVAASEWAEELGDIRSANIVMLGSFLKISQLVKPETLLDIVQQTFRKKDPKVFERNSQAFWKGYGFLS